VTGGLDATATAKKQIWTLVLTISDCTRNEVCNLLVYTEVHGSSCSRIGIKVLELLGIRIRSLGWQVV